MAVLKQTSPTARPVAPKPKPSSTVPSASTKSAVGSGSSQDGRVGRGCVAIGKVLDHMGCPPLSGGRFVVGHSRVARRDQQCPQGGDEGRRQAPGFDAAPDQCRNIEARNE